MIALRIFIIVTVVCFTLWLIIKYSSDIGDILADIIDAIASKD